jgi:hypothetical protein
MEWVTSTKQTVWEVLPQSKYSPGGAHVQEGYGQVDTDGYLRSLNGLEPVGRGVIPWGGNFGGIRVFRTEAEALRYALPLIQKEIEERHDRLTAYTVRLLNAPHDAGTPSASHSRR